MSAKTPPLIVPVFLPHAGCPHRCVFCDQHAVTGTATAIPNTGDIQRAMEVYGDNRKPNNRTVQIAFYGGNFLGLPKETIRSMLAVATRFVQAGRADSIRFSTRPDTVDDERLALISEYPVSTVEIGAQSMSDRVLDRSRRGHSAADTIQAVQILKELGFETGVQMMVGLPGDDKKTVLQSGQRIGALAPAFVRIYPTIVLADSPLGRWYTQGRYRPLDLDGAVDLTKQLLILFHSYHVPVIRMGLQASADLETGSAVMAGPYHPAFGHLVYEALFFDAATTSFGTHSPDEIIDIVVHPRNISKLRGLKNRNLQRLIDRFHPHQVNLLSDPGINQDSIIVNHHCCPVYGEGINTAISGASS